MHSGAVCERLAAIEILVRNGGGYGDNATNVFIPVGVMWEVLLGVFLVLLELGSQGIPFLRLCFDVGCTLPVELNSFFHSVIDVSRVATNKHQNNSPIVKLLSDHGGMEAFFT